MLPLRPAVRAWSPSPERHRPLAYRTRGAGPVVLRDAGRVGPGRRRSGRVESEEVSPGQVFQTWNSEICPAGQPELAVTVTRKYRAVAAVKVRVTVLLEAGSKE